MKILLTAFDAFGGQTVNPSLKAVSLVTAPEGAELVKLEVPTRFGDSIDAVTAAIRREQPQAVICVGQAGGRNAVTPERVAINLMDATMADNAGVCPVDQPVIPGGENALFATVPVKAMVQAIREAGVPAQISYTAGTFVCNQLLYGVLQFCRETCPGTQAGFIHVPFLPEQTGEDPRYPSMPLEQMVTALEAALTAIVENAPRM